MGSKIADSVVLITSSDPNRNRDFGTGFIIHKDSTSVYLLTCAHVVRDVGGDEKVVAAGFPAVVVASGEKQGFDLAVLRVEGLLNQPQLKLCAFGEEKTPFKVAGFYQFDSKSPQALREIEGHLGEQINLSSNNGKERINAWDLILEGEYGLQPGYSGSPVVDQNKGYVLGIVTHQIGKGEKGLAVSIEALKKIWLEMPGGLIENPAIFQSSPNTTSSMQFVNTTITNFVGSGQTNYREAPSFIRHVSIEPSPNETVSQSPLRKQRRIQKLNQSLEEALDLLDEYEQQERLTTDPKVRRNAQVEQERLQQQIEKYEQELKQLES